MNASDPPPRTARDLTVPATSDGAETPSIWQVPTPPAHALHLPTSPTANGTPMKTFNLYACGGTGVNLVAGLLSQPLPFFQSLVQVRGCFTDSSDSNLRERQLPASSVYLLPKLDGAGQDRSNADNLVMIERHYLQILQQFAPLSAKEGLNVFVHSAAGGTGSLLGPVLVQECLKRKLPVLVLLVGVSDTEVRATNTLQTVKTYESIAQSTGVPVACRYFDMRGDADRSSADRQVVQTLLQLAALFSGQNLELDSADLEVWLTARKSNFPARLYKLQVTTGPLAASPGQPIASVATLCHPSKLGELTTEVAFQTTGQMTDGMANQLETPGPLHYVLSLGGFQDVVQHLEQRQAEFNSQRAAIQVDSLLSSTDQVNRLGVIL